MAALFVRLLPGMSGDVGLVPNLQISIVGYRCGTPVRMSAKGRLLPAAFEAASVRYRRLAAAIRAGIEWGRMPQSGWRGIADHHARFLVRIVGVEYDAERRAVEQIGDPDIGRQQRSERPAATVVGQECFEIRAAQPFA